MIEVIDLKKRFGVQEVLCGVDIAVPAGTTTVILGGSGQGKSVLMKHMIGLEMPDSGEVRINGRNIVGLGGRALNDLRADFGMVFQNAALFDSMNVFDNVAFPLRERTKLSKQQIAAKVRGKLELFSLDASVEKKYPAELSGGMRKRVGLARATILDPKIILYDEPTTGLDPITTDQVDEMIMTAKEKLGITSVVISHDISSAFRIADQICFLYGGRIVEAGPPEVFKRTRHPEVKRFLASWFEEER
ncbi:MAG: ABC transporter ATP-binding protein [Deltaproteobacteria bacterium]|nr:ABC transporter ATP-binding protein [Deltaproteobacteria bacterium]